MVWEPGETERPRGFLTTTDREYIRGERDFSSPEFKDPDSAERNQRHRVKNRVRHGILDLIYTYLLDPEQARNIAPDPDEESELFAGFADAFAEMVAFFALYVFRGEDNDNPTHDIDVTGLLGVVEEGLRRALTREALMQEAYGVPKADIGEGMYGYDQWVSFDELKARVNAGEPVTKEQVQTLLWDDRIKEHQAENAVIVEDGETAP